MKIFLITCYVLLSSEFYVVNFGVQSLGFACFLTYAGFLFLCSINRFKFLLLPNVYFYYLLFAFLSSLIALTQINFLMASPLIGGLLILFLLLFSADVFSSNLIFRYPNNLIENIFYLLLALGLLNAFMIILGFWPKYNLIFFTEPSHYSLVFAPFVIWSFLFYQNVKSFLFFLSLLVISFVINSSILFIIVFYSLILRLIFSRYSSFKTFILIISLLFLISINSSFLSRLFGVFSPDFEVVGSSSTNVSSLVYLQGWEYIIYVVEEFVYFGFGFNQLGVNPIVTKSSDILLSLDLVLNNNDGSFLLAKLISELGILSLPFLFWFIYIFYSYFLILFKNFNYIKCSPLLLFAFSCVFSFVFPLLLRNTNYFNPAIFLFFFGSFYLIKYKNFPHVFTT